MNIRFLTRAGIIAALYTALTYALAPFSYGPVQLRVSEALTVLPILFPEAIAGLFVGVLLSNILGGLGPWDIFGGSTVSLLAAYLTYRYKDNLIAYLSPVVLNGILISLYLSVLYGVPYWLTVLSISASEAIVVFGLGYPLIRLLRRQLL